MKGIRDRITTLAANKPKQAVEFAMAMADAPTPTNPHVLVRGNPSNMGPEVPRQFLNKMEEQEWVRDFVANPSSTQPTQPSQPEVTQADPYGYQQAPDGGMGLALP